MTNLQPISWSPLLSIAILTNSLSALPANSAESSEPISTGPIAVLSIASVDRLMSDVAYLTRTAGRADVGGLVQMLAASFIEDLDRDKPAGVLIVMENGKPKGVGFLPIQDPKKALAKIEDRFGADVEQLAGNVQRLDLGAGVYLKKQGDWVFFSDEARHLARLPADPPKLLAGLNEKYDLSLRLFVQNIPLPLRQFAVEHLRASARAQMNANGVGGDPFERELAEKSQEQMLDSIENLFNNSDQITIGWAIDGQGRRTYLDLGVTAVAGSDLSQQMNRLSEVRSSHTGFLFPDATATLLVSGEFSQDQIEHLRSTLEIMRQKILADIDADPNAPSQLKEIFGTAMDVVEQTIKTGDLDMGAAVVLAPKSFRFVGGGRVADGQQLAKTFEDLFELARDEPTVPKITFRADKHRNVDLHTFRVPIPEEDKDARKVFGENLAVVVGTGPESLYLAFGTGCTDLLKTVLDKSAQNGQAAVPPLQFRIAAKPLLSFLTSVGDDAGLIAMASTLDQTDGGDGVSVTVKPVPNGFDCRIEIEEGVLRMIGQASE